MAAGQLVLIKFLLVQRCVRMESQFLLILPSLHGIYYPTDTVHCHGNGVQVSLYAYDAPQQITPQLKVGAPASMNNGHTEWTIQ